MITAGSCTQQSLSLTFLTCETGGIRAIMLHGEDERRPYLGAHSKDSVMYLVQWTSTIEFLSPPGWVEKAASGGRYWISTYRGSRFQNSRGRNSQKSVSSVPLGPRIGGAITYLTVPYWWSCRLFTIFCQEKSAALNHFVHLSIVL